MTYQKKKVDPAISNYFSKLGKSGWEAKKQKILEEAKKVKAK